MTGGMGDGRWDDAELWLLLVHSEQIFVEPNCCTATAKTR